MNCLIFRSIEKGLIIHLLRYFLLKLSILTGVFVGILRKKYLADLLCQFGC